MKQIIRNIVEGGKTYAPGMESDLEQAMSKDALKSLTTRGAISGFVAESSNEKETVEEKTEEKVTPKKKK